jgi:hypothetical protein
MTQAERIRAAHAAGHTPAEIVRLLGVPRPAVLSALRHTGPRGRPSQGKDHQVTLRLTDELISAIERAQRKGETRSACITRLIAKALGR